MNSFSYVCFKTNADGVLQVKRINSLESVRNFMLSGSSTNASCTVFDTRFEDGIETFHYESLMFRGHQVVFSHHQVGSMRLVMHEGLTPGQSAAFYSLVRTELEPPTQAEVVAEVIAPVPEVPVVKEVSRVEAPVVKEVSRRHKREHKVVAPPPPPPVEDDETDIGSESESEDDDVTQPEPLAQDPESESESSEESESEPEPPKPVVKQPVKSKRPQVRRTKNRR